MRLRGDRKNSAMLQPYCQISHFRHCLCLVNLAAREGSSNCSENGHGSLTISFAELITYHSASHPTNGRASEIWLR